MMVLAVVRANDCERCAMLLTRIFILVFNRSSDEKGVNP